jgi:hypothetical protein
LKSLKVTEEEIFRKTVATLPDIWANAFKIKKLREERTIVNKEGRISQFSACQVPG